MQGERSPLLLAAHICLVAAVAVGIELTGGLPSQLAHLYYLPVVAAALLLPLRYSLAVALLAGVAVSPLPDLIHRPLGMHVYYEDPAPWKLGSGGWILRPLAFIAVSLVAAAFVREKTARTLAQSASAAQGEELSVLATIDKMILEGAGEQDAYDEVARLVRDVSGAKHAGIIVPGEGGRRIQALRSSLPDDEAAAVQAEVLPIAEGTSGWAMLHGKIATSRNAFTDPRFDKMRELYRRLGITSSASVPIVLEGEILGALAVSFEEERDFSPEELATLQRIADQTAIAVANARQRDSLRRLSFETAIGLAEAIESRDPYTGDHCSRLSGYAGAIGTALGLGRKELEVLCLGAALHDIGKIVVPDEILKKPAALTPAEFAVIKQHCYQGGQICKRVSALRAAFPIVYHHHERFDGRGYPDGLAGDAIPFDARIVSVADAFDAITSDRPYRKAAPVEEARAILRDGAGSQWDPAIVEKFLALPQTAPPDARDAA